MSTLGDVSVRGIACLWVRCHVVSTRDIRRRYIMMLFITVLGMRFVLVLVAKQLATSLKLI